MVLIVGSGVLLRIHQRNEQSRQERAIEANLEKAVASPDVLTLRTRGQAIYDAETSSKWLSPAGELIGLRQEESSITLKFWNSDGLLTRTEKSFPPNLSFASDVHVAVDGKAIAWGGYGLYRGVLVGGKLTNLEHTSIEKTVPVSTIPTSMIITTDSDVWYTSEDGKVFWWPAGASHPLRRSGVLVAPDVQVLDQVGDLVVLASEQKMLVQAIRKGQTTGPIVNTQREFSDVAVSPSGTIAVWNSTGKGAGPAQQSYSATVPVGKTAGADLAQKSYVTIHDAFGSRNLVGLNGSIDSLLFYDESTALVAGDFPGIYSLSPTASTKIGDYPANTKLLGLRGNLLVYQPLGGGVRFANLIHAPPSTAAPSVPGQAVPTSIWIVWAVAALMLASAAAYLTFRLRVRSAQEESPAAPAATPERTERIAEPGALPEHTERIALPIPPPELIQACATGDCVLYVGAGVGAQSGFPTWRPLMEDLLVWAIQQGLVDPDTVTSLRAALQHDDTNTVADAIVHASFDRKQELDQRLREIFDERRKPSAVHQMLQRLKPAGVLTTNLDRLLETTFEQKSDRVFTSADLADAEKLLACLTTRQFFIAKLYGDLDRPRSVLLGPEDYAAAMHKNLPFSQFMDTLFLSRTLFFVGASMEGIQDYLSGLMGYLQGRRPHFALVAVTDPTWKARADLLARRYNIHVLPFTPSAGFPELLTFLQNLEAVSTMLAESRKLATPAVDESLQDSRRASPLKRVTLKNVGPFASLEFTLDPHWNVFLGDNGVGKSTILKALALAICGKDAENYAARIVSTGASDAQITLETNRDNYEIEIRRKEKEGSVTIETFPPSRPLDAEGWLAIAFPPLRTTTWQPVRLTTSSARIGPASADLIPIATGDPDPRMDKLKEWIASLYLAITTQRAEGGDAARPQALLDRLFKVIGRLTPGVGLTLHKVTTDPVQVLVKTDDGIVPIEAVSQGTVSLISWVGVVLKRLYEVYGDVDNGGDPTQQFAIVIVDEIDAHMHPEWQQIVVQKLTELFPNVQFIASTHSPLIVAGMPAHQILRIARDQDGKAMRMEIRDDAAMGRADQVLTSRLFGLKTTVDVVTQGNIEEYRRLLGNSSRNPQDEARFQELGEILRHRIPPTGETPARRAQELLQTILLEQMGHQFPGGQKEILERAAALLEELQAPRESGRAQSAKS
jgi:hypothetical protein